MQRTDDTTSDGRVPATAGSKKICRRCGNDVKTDEWYPVTSQTMPDGSIEIHAFCNETCREEWVDGRDGAEADD